MSYKNIYLQVPQPVGFGVYSTIQLFLEQAYFLVKTVPKVREYEALA